MFNTIREDVRCVLERDPAARHWFEVFTSYPGLHAVWMHRVAHALWTRRMKLPARWVSQLGRTLTGIEIHPGATIGPRLFIDHGMGVVIGETAEIGADVTLYHGVTLGGVSLNPGKRHPTLEDRVVVGAGAKVLGAITIGRNSRIGANAVVVNDVDPDSVVVGIPGKPIHRKTQELPEYRPDLRHDVMPDVVAARLDRILARLDEVERAIHVNGSSANGNAHGSNGHRRDERDLYEIDYAI
jgi:serine O-acetyltransferase